MPFAPESTTTVPAFGQGAPTATSCTSSPPEWTLFAAVSAMRFGPQRTTGVFGSAVSTSRSRESSPAMRGVSASPLPPVTMQGWFGSPAPTPIRCTSSPAAVEFATPSGPVSTTVALGPGQAAPTAIS